MSNVIQVCKVSSYLPIEKLKFHPQNPRTIRPDRLEALKKSIIEKGFYQPILVWKKGGIVLSGNHRLLACQELIKEGWEFKTPEGKTNVLPVVMEDVSEDMAMAILMETNNSYAEWIEEKLKSAIEDATKKGQEIASFGFDQAKIDEILAGAMVQAEATAAANTELQKAERTIEPPNLEALQKAVAGEELEKEQGFIVLQKGAQERLQALLQRIATIANEDWTIGNDLTEAALILVQAVNDSGVIEEMEKNKK